MHLHPPRWLAALPGEAEERTGVRQVSAAAWSAVRATPVSAPRLLAHSPALARDLGFSPDALSTPWFAEVLSGNRLLPGMRPIATNYGGHQFGHWAGQLGDGRAILLGEAEAVDGRRWELQLKGAGPTPYSRSADGRAVLRSSLREFICSEAMQALGVPTTRALSLVATGEAVVRDLLYQGDPRPEPGAIVCRVAPSFTRFGHFELPAARGDLGLLRRMVEVTIAQEFPQLSGPNATAEFFAEVARRSAVMVAHWMRVGFVHGVMNTDNMSILGLTIDYGPFGWVENFDPDWTPNTTDAQRRRYRFGTQPQVAHWNLAALASALAPLFGDDQAPLHAGMDAYARAFQQAQAGMSADKLGLAEWRDDDSALLQELYRWMQAAQIDMPLFFRRIAALDPATTSPQDLADLSYAPQQFEREAVALSDWLARYAVRLASEAEHPPLRRARMDAANPLYVPRNWLLQQAIDAAEQGDLAELQALQAVLERPYETQPGAERFAAMRPAWALDRPGCSALSCSS
ncbi:YdiU family protein [Silanimonas sp.]|uniref:protein adenylyltransferase SelO n=1 Tax=Silanimonas sp. TaxID=1929290 RepID=UPI001BC3B17C|nr:YdiU family protein [Silanimonas sp.]MBS3896717.1 YdiU family protein [Silanimonas sp.]MBS3923853.1 YdiU family protein [Xanthomonadaceae bacterium]